MGRIRLLAHSGLTMIGVVAACIMRGVQPLQYRSHPMWDFNGEDDATRHGRNGPDSAAALIKILSTLYKGGGISPRQPTGWIFYVQSPKLGKWSLLLAHLFYIPIVKNSV